MKQFALCVLIASGLTACADPMNRPPTGQLVAEKPACSPDVDTGSHIVDRSCNPNKQSLSISGSALQAAMRQTNQGGITSH